MNIDHKKTALKDDSILYQKQHDSVDKDYLKNMSAKGKLQYFVDYYLKAVVIGIIILVVAINLVSIVFFSKGEDILGVVFLNGCTVTDENEVRADLLEYLEPENKDDDIIVSNFDLTQYQVNMVFQTRLAVNQVDLIVCIPETFREIAAQGIVMDLSEILPADHFEKLSDKICMAAQAAETDDNGIPLSYKEEQPFGINVSDSAVLRGYGIVAEEYVLCVAVNSERIERVVQTLEYWEE